VEPPKGSWNLHNISTNRHRHTRTHVVTKHPTHKNFQILCGCLFNWFELIWSLFVVGFVRRGAHFIVMILAFENLWKCAILRNPITRNCQAAFNLWQSNVFEGFVALAGLIKLQMCSRIDIKNADICSFFIART